MKQKFVPKDKMSKKARREENAAGRASWGEVHPVTKVIPNKKHYNRKKEKMTDE